jgi:excisionase family DNA binding protein
MFDDGVNKPETPSSVPKLAITIAETAAATGFSQSYIRLCIARGDLPVIQVGRARRILPSDVQAFLLARRLRRPGVRSAASAAATPGRAKHGKRHRG